MMEKETASTRKSEPIIIEQAGMRMTVAHRQGLGGSDEGLTFDITTSGAEDEGKKFPLRLLLQKPSLPHRRRQRTLGSQHERRRCGRPGPLDFGTAQDPVPFDCQTSRIREDRREGRQANDCGSAPSVRTGNNRQVLTVV